MKEARMARTKPCIVPPSPLKLGKRDRRRAPRERERTQKHKKKNLPGDSAVCKKTVPSGRGEDAGWHSMLQYREQILPHNSHAANGRRRALIPGDTRTIQRKGSWPRNARDLESVRNQRAGHATVHLGTLAMAVSDLRQHEVGREGDGEPRGAPGRKGHHHGLRAGPWTKNKDSERIRPSAAKCRKQGRAREKREKTGGGSTSQEQAGAVEAGRQGDLHNSARGLPGDSHKHSCGRLGSIYERAGTGWISGYITRWGRKGEGGIDHIFFPRRDNPQAWVTDATIEQQLGRAHFLSDHAMLKLTITRHSPDENRQEEVKEAYLYQQLVNIRMKQGEGNPEELEFDETQYHTDVVVEQEELLRDVRTQTGDQDPVTVQLPGPIRDKIELLVSSLWEDAQEQGASLRENILVRANAEQARKLEDIADWYDAAIKEAMTRGKLVWQTSTVGKVKKARERVKETWEIYEFKKMTMTAKLRSTKVEVRRIRASVLRINAAYAQAELRRKVSNAPAIRQERSIMNTARAGSIECLHLGREIEKCLQETVLPEHAEECESLMQAELEKWWDHTNTVREANIASTRRCQQGTGSDKVYDDMWGRAGGDVLPHLGDKDIEEMNKCLKRHGCTHLFQKEHPGGITNRDLMNADFNAWKEPLRRLSEWRTRGAPNDPRYETLPCTLLDQTLAALRALDGRLTWWQSKHRSCFANYACNIKSTGHLARRLLPKGRSPPTVHRRITDESTGSVRFCRSEGEQLLATKEYHQRWMDASGAKEEVAYCKLVTEEGLGIRGVQLALDREVTEEDLDRLLPNHRKLEKETVAAYLEAHRKCVAELFRPPAEPNAVFNDPFIQRSRGGDNRPEGASGLLPSDHSGAGESKT